MNLPCKHCTSLYCGYFCRMTAERNGNFLWTLNIGRR